ncbi:hypothetical protein AURDEDRAFT_165015 [Auricularia subglabra TFB-10046 SS5]|nr:hypothetical protein AURDEDRAFT_165015 [Auricularia subglabra TFB-10046 SS5]
MSAFRNLYRQWRQHWFALEAVPLYTILGGAGVGTAWYLTHLASRPEVLWARKANPTPWNSVKQDETTKLWHGERPFDKTWKREKF